MNTITEQTGKTGFKLLSLLIIMSGAFFGYTIYSYLKYSKWRLQSILKTTETEALTVVDQIQDYLKQIEAHAKPLIQILNEQPTLPEKKIKDEVSKILLKEDSINSISIAFAPYAYNEKKEFYAPFFIKKDEEILVKRMEDFYDYTHASWYIDIIKKKGPVFSEPFKEVISENQVIRFSFPVFIYDVKQQVRIVNAIINFDIPAAFFDKFTQQVTSNRSYGFIVTRKGTFIAHPTKEYVTESKTILNVASQPGQMNWRKIAQKVLEGEKGIFDFENTITKQQFWVAAQPISPTGWVAFVVYEKNNVIIIPDAIRHMYIHIILSGALFLILLIFSIVYLTNYREPLLWIFIVIFSILCFLIMILLWYFDSKSQFEVSQKQEPVYDNESLQRFLRLNKKLRIADDEKTIIFIKTGIYIQSFAINERGEITIKGLLWQHYPKKILKSYDLGLNITNVAHFELKPAYTQETADEKIVGWYFSALLKNQFTYKKYPLDKYIITLTIENKNLTQNVILIPNFEAWKGIEGSIGLDPQMEILGWDIISGFFGYQLVNYATNLGLFDYEGQKNFPLLSYNIEIRRNFVYPMVSGFMPIFLIIFILFTLLLFSTPQIRFTDVLAQGYIGIIAAILFATVLSHQRMKDVLGSVSGISFLEYFYFCLYIILLLVATNILLYISRKDIELFQYKDNIISKLIYWPIVSLTFLIITLSVFY